MCQKPGLETYVRNKTLRVMEPVIRNAYRDFKLKSGCQTEFRLSSVPTFCQVHQNCAKNVTGRYLCAVSIFPSDGFTLNWVFGCFVFVLVEKTKGGVDGAIIDSGSGLLGPFPISVLKIYLPFYGPWRSLYFVFISRRTASRSVDDFMTTRVPQI